MLEVSVDVSQAHNMYGPGQTCTYTPPHGGAVQTFLLPEIDESHLRDIRLEAGGVIFRGFHFLPRGVTFAAGASTTLATGAVKVLDANGVEIDPAHVAVTITPERTWNNDPFNPFRARVDVTHPGGTATVHDKTFFPPEWTWRWVVQAIYDSVVRFFTGHGAIPANTPVTSDTHEGAHVVFTYDPHVGGDMHVTSAYPARGGLPWTLNQMPLMSRP